MYNHLRNAWYLGSITILSFGVWIPREIPGIFPTATDSLIFVRSTIGSTPPWQSLMVSLHLLPVASTFNLSEGFIVQAFHHSVFHQF